MTERVGRVVVNNEIEIDSLEFKNFAEVQVLREMQRAENSFALKKKKEKDKKSRSTISKKC